MTRAHSTASENATEERSIGIAGPLYTDHSLPLAAATGRDEARGYAAAWWRASSAWYSLNSSATALAMLGRARSRS
jgi:hypothetical protein